ncbi:MAG: hypothetical protein WCE21_05815 [Candidatus Babeliales bacterium]
MNTKLISLRIIAFLSLTVPALCPIARGMEQGTGNSISKALAQKALYAPKLIATKMYEHPWYTFFGASTLLTAGYIGLFVYREIKGVRAIARKGQQQETISTPQSNNASNLLNQLLQPSKKLITLTDLQKALDQLQEQKIKDSYKKREFIKAEIA